MGARHCAVPHPGSDSPCGMSGPCCPSRSAVDVARAALGAAPAGHHGRRRCCVGEELCLALQRLEEVINRVVGVPLDLAIIDVADVQHAHQTALAEADLCEPLEVAGDNLDQIDPISVVELELEGDMVSLSSLLARAILHTAEAGYCYLGECL